MLKMNNFFEKISAFDGQCSPFFIAEIGSNHMNNIDIAKDSIVAAVESGAHAVKFQSISLESLYFSPGDLIVDLHSKIDMEENWHGELKDFCDSRGVIFFSSPTYLKAVDILSSLDIALYKIASAQVGVFPQLVEKVASLNKPTIMSTGIVTLGELDKVVGLFNKYNNRSFALLHCNSVYPTPPNCVHLDRMDLLRSCFKCPVGFSDHTEGNAIALAAVARGADIIEKHFTLSRDFDSPDAFFSCNPTEFKSLVDDAIAIKKALYNSDDFALDLEPEELSFKTQVIYRLVLQRDKKAGDVFTQGDFEYKRHPSGIDCRDEVFLLDHMCAKSDLQKGSLLYWDMLEGKS